VPALPDHELVDLGDLAFKHRFNRPMRSHLLRGRCPGDWKGVLVEGAVNRSSVGALVERLSGYAVHRELRAADNLLNNLLNNRPRKILNFHSRQKVFSMLTSELIPGVAFQD